MKNILLPISIVVLAVSVALGSFFIAGAMKEQGKAAVAAAEITAGKAAADSKTLLSEQEAADYVGLSAETFHKTLTSSIKEQKSQEGIFDTYQYIPYMKIDDDSYFLKSELDKWAEYNIQQNSELKSE